MNITGQTVPFFQDTNKSPGAVTSILNSGALDSSQSQSPSKTNSSQPSLVHSTMHNVLDSPIRPAGTKRVLDERSNSPESSISQKVSKNGSSTQHKRIRMMSDSDSENGSPVKKGTDLSGKTSELEEKLTFLKNAYCCDSRVVGGRRVRWEVRSPLTPFWKKPCWTWMTRWCRFPAWEEI